MREEELVPEGEQGTVEGFAVQVGAFRLEENARALEARVAAAGFGRVRVSEGEDSLFRVWVGSFPGREGAESLGDSLGSVLGLGYSIVPGRAAP